MADFWGGMPEEDCDEDDGGEYIVEQLRIVRDIDDPIPIKLEAVLCNNMTSVTIRRTDGGRPTLTTFFIKTLDPEMVLNYLEDKFYAGSFVTVINYLKTQPQVIEDPFEFRLKLDTLLLGGTLSIAAGNSGLNQQEVE